MLMACGLFHGAPLQAQQLYPSPPGFDEGGFQFEPLPVYSTDNPFDVETLRSIDRGFVVFTTETFSGNGRTCSTCHMPEHNYNLDIHNFRALTHEGKDLVLGGSNRDLENREAITESVLFNINQQAGSGTEGTGAEPEGPFRSSMTIGGVGFTTLNYHVCREDQPTPGGIECRTDIPASDTNRTNRGVDDGVRDIMIGWAGEGPLAEMFPFEEPLPGNTDATDCAAIIDEFAADPASLTNLDLGLATFALAAVKTHFPRSQNRQPGVDFICPTRDQLLDMSRFQKWLGRRFELNLTQLRFRAPEAQHGRNLFSTRIATCIACHVNAGASDTQGRVKTFPVPFLTMDGQPDFEFNENLNEPFNIIGMNKTSRNGSQALELALVAQFESFAFPFDEGDGQLRGGPQGQGPRQGGFNVQSIIEAVRNRQFFHNNGVVGTIEDAIRFYFTDDFKESQGGNAISGDFRLAVPGVEETELTPAEALAALGGEDAIHFMGLFLRSLSAVYSMLDCERFADEMLDRIEAGLPVDLPAMHCGFALADSATLIQEAALRPREYPRIRHAVLDASEKLTKVTEAYNTGSQSLDKVKSAVMALARDFQRIRRTIAVSPELDAQ